MRLSKYSKWNFRDIYRLPVAVVLGLLVARNYYLRRKHVLPDGWYWADVTLLYWGYVVNQIDAKKFLAEQAINGLTE